MIQSGRYYEVDSGLQYIGRNIRQRRVYVADKVSLFALIKKIFVLVIVLFIIFNLIFGVAPAKGDDMQPKIAAGDVLLFYRLGDDYLRNEVVLIHRDDAQYVGRVIGVPGDVIEISSERHVVINGAEVIETNIFFETQAFSENVQYPLTLAPDEFFLLGDNRESAKDSRYFGPIKRDEIEGKIITTLKRNDI